MIGSSWNCRGLGNPRAVRALKELIKRERPKILFLMETKRNKSEWDQLKVKLKCKKCFVVDCGGCSGGLAMLWENSIDLTIKSYSSHHIDAWIKSDGVVWRWIGFYGHWDSAKRHESWDLLRCLGRQNNLPWVCC